MSTQRKPTVDDLYDRRYHNQPETGSLSMAELETVEAGRTALQSLHKTFDLWVAIGRAVVTLREEADRFTPTDTAANVARTLVGMFSPDKVKDIIRRAEALLKERTGKSGKTKTEAEPAPDVLQKAAEPVNAMLGELFNATLPKAKS